MTLQPTGNKIMVRVDDEVSRTESGILLQSGSARLPSIGTIEAIGPDVKKVRVGDRVEFLRYAALTTSEDKDLRWCTPEMILAIYAKNA